MPVSFYILFLDAPVFDLQFTTPDVSCDQGDDIDLVCNATGVPTPSVEWTRLGNQLLPIGQEKYEVFIPNSTLILVIEHLCHSLHERRQARIQQVVIIFMDTGAIETVCNVAAPATAHPSDPAVSTRRLSV